MIRPLLKSIGLAAMAMLVAGSLHAQIAVGPGGINFDLAAKVDPKSKNFRTNDGVLTIAFITHTAGNGFFNPAYIGATAAAQMWTAVGIPVNLLRLGPPDAADNIPATNAIINQVLTDPKLDGLAITAPQVGAYETIINKAFELGIPVATHNSADPTIPHRSEVSHTGQDASAAALGGEGIIQCLRDRKITKGVVIFPGSPSLGNVEVNNRVRAAAGAVRAGIKKYGLSRIAVDDGQGEGIEVSSVVAQGTQDIINIIQSTPDIVGLFGPNGGITPAIGNAIRITKTKNKICSFGFDLGPSQIDLISTGDLGGSLGQQPFLQGFWPIMQIVLQIDRGVSAANLDTRAEVVTKANLSSFKIFVDKRFTN